MNPVMHSSANMMSSSSLFSPSPGEDTPGLVGVMIRFRQGRTIYSGKDVKRVSDHYITTAGSGIRASIFMLQFLRNAFLAFASTNALAQLKNLPAPTTQATLDQHLDILLADEAPLRMQAEVEARSQSLFFVGNVVNSADIQSLAPSSERKPAVRIPRDLSQSVLAILVRYQDGIASFPQQDIQTLCSYMKQLSIRGENAWVSLVAFLRDAARPFASNSLRRELGRLPNSNDQSLVVKKYNLLVVDGAMDRLMEAARTRPNPNFYVKADASGDLVEGSDQDDDEMSAKEHSNVSEHKDHELPAQRDDKLPGVGDDAADEEADDKTYDKENEDPEVEKRPQSPKLCPPAAKEVGSNDHFRVPLVGKIGLAGNALPSLTKKRRRERETKLSPRQIRDLVRQYDKSDSQSQLDIIAQKEVFYVGGKKRYQIRPEYIWVLAQQLEEDEPPIPETKMTAICPQREQFVALGTAQQVAPNNDVSLQSQEVKGRFLGNGITLQEIASKLDALTNEVTAMTRVNKELMQEIRKVTMSSHPKQRAEVSSFPFLSNKKRRFDPESEGTALLSSDSIDTPTKKPSKQKLQIQRTGHCHGYLT